MQRAHLSLLYLRSGLLFTPDTDDNNPWIQGKSVGAINRFDLGGMGTTDDPGIRWYFEHVRRLVGRELQ